LELTEPIINDLVTQQEKVIGQRAISVDGTATAGEDHRAIFDASQFASGIYFSRLEFGGRTQIKKLLLLK